jgi:pimeloyl-ACP methyl ester carboxylesterase
LADNNLAQPEEKWAKVNGLDMRYLDWGGDGEPLLALHGLASSAHWYDIVARLLRHRYRIIAPDQRGHGQTTQAASGYDWHTLSDDLAELLAHVSVEIPGFGQPVAALGHSWGGHVVSNFAAHYPGRVRRIVMIDGGFLDGRLFPEPTWEAFSGRLRPRNVTGDREEFLNRLREQMAGWWNSEIERIVQTMVYEDEDGQIQDILRPQNQAQVIRAMWDDPCSRTLPQVQCPALLIAAGPMPERANSDFAQLRNRMVGAAEAALPNGRAHWIPETVHDIGYHKPEELARVILEFLDE